MSVPRILLDTNAPSELMRPSPEPQVLDWFTAQGAQSRFEISAIDQPVGVGTT